MKTLKMMFVLLFAGLTTNSFAQTNSSAYAKSSNHQKIINKMEGAAPMPFQAPDMEGTTHFLPEYKGRVIVIAFWSTADDISRRQISSLNRLQNDYGDYGMKVLSMAAEDKPDLISFLKNNKINYPVIPNSKALGEMGYADELGESRIYVVDKKGVIKKVYVTTDEKDMQTYDDLKPIIEELLK